MNFHELHPVQQRILQDVQAGKPNLVGGLADSLGMSRQGIHHHIRILEGEGLLRGEGRTRARQYHLQVLAEETVDLEVSPGLAEDVVFRERIEPLLEDLPAAAAGRCYYAFTEIFNNAIDHSAGRRVRIEIERTAMELRLSIADDGVGIFDKIQRALGLDDPRLSVFELSKGKLTTDPENHTGEGIFFSMRMAERFGLASGGLRFRVAGGRLELEEPEQAQSGTRVDMGFDLSSARTSADVFDAFTATAGEFGFTRTRVVVELAKVGSGDLVSRSQARRVLERLDRFEEVVLDFTGVEMIGQGFADEVFRVFRGRHPAVLVSCERDSERVARMIRHVLAGRRDPWLEGYERQRERRGGD